MVEANLPGLWLIIPVKPFAAAKSRLAGRLSPAQRADMSRQLLTRLLGVVSAVDGLAGVIVVSRDPEALGLADSHGAMAILEEEPGLNAALELGRRKAVDAGAQAILILPSDLPLIAAEDVNFLQQTAVDLSSRWPLNGHTSDSPSFAVIVRSPDGGTNALLLHPPFAIPFAFGSESYRLHCELARQAGIDLRPVTSPNLALDVDRPADLDAWQRRYTRASAPQA